MTHLQSKDPQGPLQENKRSLLFDYFDLKKDGVLDKEEFMVPPNSMIAAGNVEGGRRWYALDESMWQRMNAALAKPADNETFTREEFMAASKMTSSGEWHDKVFIPGVADILFRNVDTNNDGVITPLEWRAYQNTWGMKDEAVIAETFAKLDENGDGKISPEELKNAIMGFGTGGNDYDFLFISKPSNSSI